MLAAGSGNGAPPGAAATSRAAGAAWRDMLTVNVFEGVRTGEELAEVANKVLGNYQARGKVLRTDSKPGTADRRAEHLIVAALGGGDRRPRGAR
jgi:hypothetical protein